MTLTLRALPLLAALALTACEAPGGTTPPTEAPPATGEAPPPGDMPAPVLPSPADDTCGASGLATYIGQDASILDTARFANPVRVIRPGDMTTMDFNPQRLNFELDGLGEIERIRCG
ncbi:MAG TPA: I78 family peptidase inhibitor [Rubellimicrobium sp.]|nr:I78 family peptidase inhibitor [Rubellimicrobium sp.]